MIKSILIVDDEADITAITKLGLEMSTPWTVYTANSGEASLAIAQKKQPDLILLDLMMPHLDGRSTLKLLKSNQYTEHIPVILVTAKDQESLDESLLGLDVVTILHKPFRPLELAAQINQALN